MSRRRWLRGAAGLAAVLALVAAIWWFGANRRAAAWFDGDRATWLALSEGVSRSILARGGSSGVDTGSALFDGEWDLVTCQMAVVGLAQVALKYPEAEARFRPARDRCLDWLITDHASTFATNSWGRGGPEQLQDEPSHAYLGYVDLALGLDRLVRPPAAQRPAHIAFHDRLTGLLASHLDAPVRRFQTYPGETYPPDLSTVAAAIAVHGRSTGHPPPAALEGWLTRFEAAAVDPESGWVYQSISPESGAPVYGTRGSGTAFTAAWLAWADPELSGRLLASLTATGHRSFLGFGGMREYPPGSSGWGDIDSGPVIFGVGVSATGFALYGARVHGDRATHRRLYRTAHLFGLPVRGGRRFATGMDIGNAIMLAMLTAPTASEQAHALPRSTRATRIRVRPERFSMHHRSSPADWSSRRTRWTSTL